MLPDWMIVIIVVVGIISLLADGGDWWIKK